MLMKDSIFKGSTKYFGDEYHVSHTRVFVIIGSLQDIGVSRWR